VKDFKVLMILGVAAMACPIAMKLAIAPMTSIIILSGDRGPVIILLLLTHSLNIETGAICLTFIAKCPNRKLGKRKECAGNITVDNVKKPNGG
jgi:hypothetical protein